MSHRRTRWFVVGGLVVATALAAGASRWASSQPDGLEEVSVDEGFEETAEDHPLGDGPFADYGTEGADDEGSVTGIAGVVGVAATFVVAGGAVALVGAASRRRAGRAGQAGRDPDGEPGAGSNTAPTSTPS